MIGVARDGVSRRGPAGSPGLVAGALRPASRPQATSPDRHSSSSHSRPVAATRAGSTRRSQAPAASSKPWSCSITASTPRRPSSCVSGATCCQRSRKRMKSCAVTGSISRRSRSACSGGCARAAAGRRTPRCPSRAGSKRPAQREALGLEPGQRELASTPRRAPVRAASRAARAGPRRVEVAAHQRRRAASSRRRRVGGERGGQRARRARRARSGNSASTRRRCSAAHQSAARRPCEHASRAPGRARARRTRPPSAGSRPQARTSASSRSCSSSASRGVGRASSRTRAIASGSSAPSSRAARRAARAAARRARAALLERRVVEERVGPAVQDLVRERRRLGRVAGDAARTSPASMPSSSAHEPVDVHRLVQAVVHVWRTSGWSGISMRPGAAFSWQPASAGKTAAIRSSASMRWIGGGFLLPPRMRSTASARFEVPAPAQRRTSATASTACASTSRDVLGAQEAAARPRAGSCAAGRARARSRRRWPPPAARSRTRRRSACAARGRARG